MIRDNDDESDPVCSLDPISFIYVFAHVLAGLVPRDVVRRRKDEIYEVMGKLARIVKEENGSSWPNSRKKCVENACAYFRNLDLADSNLRPKLKRLGDTWNSWRCN